MDLFAIRVSEIRDALREHKLMNAHEQSSFLKKTHKPPEEPRPVLELNRSGHALLLIAFPDGALLFVLKTTAQESSFIALLAKPMSRAWQVQISPNLPKHCSETLLKLWGRMPPRKDASTGTFTKENGLLALKRLTESFAAIN